jgi:Single-strand binding protein family
MPLEGQEFVMFPIEIIGNLGSEPEQRFTAAGVAQTTFRTAVNSRRKGPDGENVERTDWFRVRTMGSKADYVQRFTKAQPRYRLYRRGAPLVRSSLMDRSGLRQCLMIGQARPAGHVFGMGPDGFGDTWLPEAEAPADALLFSDLDKLLKDHRQLMESVERNQILCERHFLA